MFVEEKMFNLNEDRCLEKRTHIEINIYLLLKVRMSNFE